jgi:hypothetical protein
MDRCRRPRLPNDSFSWNDSRRLGPQRPTPQAIRPTASATTLWR